MNNQEAETQTPNKCHVCNDDGHTHMECSYIHDVIEFNNSLSFLDQDVYQRMKTIQQARALRKVRENNRESIHAREWGGIDR